MRENAKRENKTRLEAAAGPARAPQAATAARRRRERRLSSALVAACALALLLAGPALGRTRPGPIPEPPAPPAPDAPDERPALDPFLLEETRVEVKVAGPVARALVTQVWHNPNATPLDGLYVFPLPEDAAVNAMRLVIGERVIEAELKRREEARADYERARDAGRLAALLDQERPNVFAQRVANIAPNARIEVRIAYEQVLEPEAGRYELVVPTVVGPRFVPAEMADPGDIDPPTLAPGARSGQRFDFEALIEAPVTIEGLASPSHAVHVDYERPSRARVRLADRDERRLDRDLRLAWRLGGESTELGALAWRDPAMEGTEGAFLLMLTPPAEPARDEITPRELVFVLDCSGSMAGAPLDAAKEVVRRTLSRLHPRDTFRILRFSERASGLSEEALANTPANVARALGYLERLSGSGGTRMIEGIRAAFAPEADPERLRVVAFLTDGYIGNERAVAGEVARLIGDARLFSFGVGSSVNRYLLETLAEEGRGASAFQDPREDPAELVDAFVRRIDAPVLTDIRLRFEGLRVAELEPARVPDLFAGQPLVVAGRYEAPGAGVLVVEGRVAGRPVTLRHALTLPARDVEHEALARLWARARLHRLERELHRGASDAVRERIARLALAYRLASSETSFVAVDTEAPALERSGVGVEVPVERPRDVPLSAGPAIESRYTAGVGVTRSKALRTFAASGQGQLSADAAEFEAARPGPTLREEVIRIPVPSGDEAEEASAARPAPIALTLTRAGGGVVALSASGELWLEEGDARTHLVTLSTRRLAELRRLVEALPADEGRVSAEDARGVATLELRVGASRRVYALSGGSPALARLVAWLERLALQGKSSS